MKSITTDDLKVFWDKLKSWLDFQFNSVDNRQKELEQRIKTLEDLLRNPEN